MLRVPLEVNNVAFLMASRDQNMLSIQRCWKLHLPFDTDCEQLYDLQAVPRYWG